MITDLADMEVEGRVVLVQSNLDVPMADGEIVDDTRIRAGLKTIEYLLTQNCKVIVCGHLGRPEGKKDPALSTAPVAARLANLLGVQVIHIPDVIGDEAHAMIEKMPEGSVAVLENLRFEPGQQEMDEEFARKLASLAEIFCNDDYTDAHRSSAVNVLLPKLLPSCMGYTLKSEWSYVRRVCDDPAKPFVLIIGGAKADKIGVINHLLGTVDHIIVGGVLANTFLKASGVDIKDSKFDERSLEIAGEFLREAEEKFLLPVDVVVANEFKEDAAHVERPVNDIPDKHMILDVGSQTTERYASIIEGAQTIVWGGPVGVFEWDTFSRGTLELAKAIAESDGYSLVAGGDSGEAVRKFNLADKMNHVSIGGGATLQLIAGEALPAISALDV